MQATKQKADKLIFIKNKKICSLRDTIEKVKIQPTGWEKISVNHMSDKGLAFRIYKELLQANNKK